MSERTQAIALANRILDRVNADPDDDLGVLARQMLRATEDCVYIGEAPSDHMVERVARALAMSRGAAFCGPGQSIATREFGWKPDGEHLEKYVEAHWKDHVHAAGFAIVAMRVPIVEPNSVEF